jgi:hypothetical protein
VRQSGSTYSEVRSILEPAPAFDELLARLRDREEWRYVDRELDIRVRLVE